MPQGPKNVPKVTRSVEFEFERHLREFEVELVPKVDFEFERELELELELKLEPELPRDVRRALELQAKPSFRCVASQVTLSSIFVSASRHQKRSKSDPIS